MRTHHPPARRPGARIHLSFLPPRNVCGVILAKVHAQSRAPPETALEGIDLIAEAIGVSLRRPIARGSRPEGCRGRVAWLLLADICGVTG